MEERVKVFIADAIQGIATSTCLYTYGNIPEKKLKNLTEAAGVSTPEEVLVLIDETLMGSAKTGLLVTTENLVWHIGDNIKGSCALKSIESVRVESSWGVKKVMVTADGQSSEFPMAQIEVNDEGAIEWLDQLIGLITDEERLIRELNALDSSAERAKEAADELKLRSSRYRVGPSEVVTTTGDLRQPYTIIDTIFCYGSDEGLMGTKPDVQFAYEKVRNKVRAQCVKLGGNAVVHLTVEYRIALADQILGSGKNQVIEFWAYGTVVLVESEHGINRNPGASQV